MPTNSNLQTVASRIQGAVKSFCTTRYQTNPIFFMADLTKYVTGYPGLKVAPGSPERILRNMRAAGTVRYDCINRMRSLYRVNGVA
jgi:hypothetical protein